MYSVNMGGRYRLSVNIPLAFKKKKKSACRLLSVLLFDLSAKVNKTYKDNLFVWTSVYFRFQQQAFSQSNLLSDWKLDVRWRVTEYWRGKKKMDCFFVFMSDLENIHYNLMKLVHPKDRFPPSQTE